MRSSVFNSDASGYQLTWVTDHLAVGYAPLSNQDIASMSEQGMKLKAASKILKNTRANPTNHCQWQLLRKYGKKIKILNRSALGGKTCHQK